jgi:GNAT superfamily N-acetyltransferase
MRVQVRPAETDEEFEQLIETQAAVSPEARLTVAELRAIERAIDLLQFLAELDGEVAGTAALVKPPRLRASKGAHVSVAVPREFRGRGVGSALYRELSVQARGADVDWFETIVGDDDPESLGWAERRGFVVQRREPCVELDVTAIEPPPVEPPPGIEIVTWAERPESTRGMYEVAVETYRDIPGNEDDAMETYEEWLAEDMRGPGDLPEATFMALAGDEVVGYAKFSLTEAQPDVAHHDLTGVKRAWRRRGIAGALKRAEIAWAKRAGYKRLTTTNEERNEPIRRLNERLGYRPAPGRLFLRGPLAPT